ncbi:polysaccharide pyruvyl transferase family protein [Fibrobacter sp. UWB5]|uniref:polysaccharide pyruvyl transferase family protein n=1 Tax=Fibrobacter sp. UWB5 TaxID=1964360 RepID=UPI000B5269E3|nr:polysaccharide pyruvyl transferase family protein [Fibrobacter sp. UWB5]OWV14307.1 hypothetical protein B7989_02275 [Fibrobacter sp. UWB5]
MKIGILNLALDNNYGGNLQRFALITFLQKLGHQAKHIQIKGYDFLPWYKVPYAYPKRFVLKFVLHKINHIRQEKFSNQEQKDLWKTIEPFYEHYVPHTGAIKNKEQLKIVSDLENFDAVIVGSDQVWRASMTRCFGMSSYMLDFVSRDKTKKIAYAVSLGVDNPELNPSQAMRLNNLYRQFSAVSVRESSALKLFDQYGWTYPRAEVCVDPTLLLDVEDYNRVIDNANVNDCTTGKIFAYLLDATFEKENRIRKESAAKKFAVHCMGLHDASTSIEQWLNNIRRAEMVVTDSFHGVVFSVIFDKPFLFLGNQRRGNARLLSLLVMLDVDPRNLDCFIHVQKKTKLIAARKKSAEFLKMALET